MGYLIAVVFAVGYLYTVPRVYDHEVSDWDGRAERAVVAVIVAIAGVAWPLLLVALWLNVP